MQQENNRSKFFWWIITSFLLVPLIVSVVSTIHVINFFELSNYKALAITLAIAFEIGALSALAGLVALDKINKNVVWFIFCILTAYQMMGNSYFAYDYMSNKMVGFPSLIKNWTELFGFSSDPDDLIVVKRIIAVVSGAILPIVSLSFLDLSVDYIQKSTGVKLNRPVGKSKEVEEKEVETKQPESSELISPGIPIIENDNKTEPKLEYDKSDTEQTHEIEDESKLYENLENTHEDFQKIIDDKKKKLEELREPNLDLLNTFYKNGETKIGDELPSYNDFTKMVDLNVHSQSDIKKFLTLCNYLEIFRLTGTQKIALKSYEEASQALGSYLSWN